MNIGLMGFEFESENLGCEALSYSIFEILKNICKDSNIPKIYYFSNLGMGHIQQYYPEFYIEQFPLKIKDPKLQMLRAFKKCDFILDVTMGDSFSDIYSKEVCLSDMRFKNLAEFFAKKYILMPQTYGPFSDTSVKKHAYCILKKADKVYCRDSISQNYIKDQFNIINSFLTTDIAFFLPFDKGLFSFNENRNIGINISGLLWRGGFSGNNQFSLKLDYQLFINRLIQLIHNKYPDYMIHLIPHVINRDKQAHDDDYKICEAINKQYNFTKLAPQFKDPIEAKSYIANMSFFIGSRMHSTVAALSTGVPTVPVSYSRKFEGLFGSINYPYSINGKLLDCNEAIDYINDAMDKREEIKATVLNSKEIVTMKMNEFMSDFSKLINGSNL